MKNYQCLVPICCWLFLATCPSAAAQEVTAARISPADKCPVCGMFVAKYPDFVTQIVFKNGTYAFFDGVKDMMKYYFDLSNYKPGKTTADIAAIWVTDYYTMELSDGLQSRYVVGSDVYGPMGKELIPFKDEAAAEEFKVDHKGTAVLSFQDITPALIKTLDQ